MSKNTQTKNQSKNIYDDGNIPEIDLPKRDQCGKNVSVPAVEPLPESERPRRDGPGGE